MIEINDNLKKEEKQLKEIELKSCISRSKIRDAVMRPNRFYIITRLCKYQNYDLILAELSDGEKFLYFGHWNDGIVKE